MTSFNEWIDMKINDGDIHYVEYNEFSCVKKVGEGSFGIVESADWKSRGIKIASKTLIDHSSVDENSMNKFVKELKNLKEANFHQNINKFFGISKEPLSNKYAMILEFANQGNLREYLKNSFKFLLWSDKIQMSLDIVSGLKYLHSKQIIHRDLHAKNILVDNNRLMIADFGTSKQLSESTPNSTNSTANGLGMAEYNEPQLFKIVNYKKDKKSDIYSLGVLLWEISSGRPPFPGYSRIVLGSHISYLDIREKPIEGTPLEYQQLYQKCWNGDPDLRPDIDEVYEALSCISVPANQIQSLLTDLKPILGQIRPLFPPVLTPFDLLSNYTINLLSNCTISQFNALQAYRYACILRAQDQGLNLPLHTISLMTSILWCNESAGIKQIYLEIAEQATQIYNYHYLQFENI